ncbi:MAG: hypothetical protein OZ923_03200 [Comamonadaceae bacterium]|nr:hypothetical protein [Burkholderiales bacterium]MEB2347596.1 hypothetical protein [Comamonadaceae bacterium]
MLFFVDIPSDVMRLPKADIPGRLAGAIYDASSEDEDVLTRYHLEVMKYESLINDAVHLGSLIPREPGTNRPLPFATSGCCIDVEELAQFLESNRDEVRIRIIQADTQRGANDTASTGKKWTPERRQKLASYRKKHGTKAAAEHYGISGARIRELLPKEPKEAKKPKKAVPYSAFTHLIK